MTYDAASQLTAASDPVSTYAYTYDLAGRLTSVNNAGTPGVPNVVLSYGYDAVNNLTAVTDTINGVQAGTETASYDALNRVTQMTQSGVGVAAKRVEMAYDAASQMTGLSRYGSLTGTQVIAGTSYAYDGAGRLTDLTHQRGTTVIADYGFTYDAANRLTQLTTPDGTSDYSYNDRYELTGSDHSYQGDEAYTYDATGNRTSYTTGDHNRLLNDGTYSYEYDNEGNRTRRVDIATGAATEYTWDYRNRLTGVVSKNGAGAITQTVLYAYDVYNRRLSSAVDSDGAGAGAATEEHFVYDGSHIALVFDGASTLTHRYFHGPQIDQVLAEETAGQTRWALGDHQGSVRDVINNTGTVLNHTTYDGFGQVTSESNPALDFRFGYTGRETDEESALMQYRARYYDPAVGAFVSADPLGFGSGDSNLYSYVFNSPTNFTDPSGESAIGDGVNRFLANDTVYNTLNRADQFAAGFGSGATFGLTNAARSAIYRDGSAQRNQSGLTYTVGNITGDIATSIVLTAATIPRRIRQAYIALDTARTGIDVGRSANNIYQDIRNGCTDSAGSLGDYLTIGGALVGVGINTRGTRNGPNNNIGGDLSGRFDELASGLPKADLRASIRDESLTGITEAQQQAILKKLQKGKVDAASVKVVNANGNIRLVLERTGKVSGFQRLTLEIDPSGNTVGMVQTAFDDSG